VRTLLALLLFAPLSLAQIPDDAAIRKLLADRIDKQKQGVGIVVGVIEPNGRRVIAHGTKDGKAKVDGDTVFEIGSTTKVFTALLLADMAAKDEVEFDDPVAKYLPSEVKVAKNITLVDLATHTSGLPRLPGNMAPKDPDNPYADYTVAQLYDALAKIEPAHTPGTHYDYSNLGAGLLGHALALRSKTDYETLVRTRILEPLGMKSTAITLSKELQARLAAGHDAFGKPAANWDLPTLAGAGALRSTANDMLNFLAAAVDPKSPLRVPMARLLATRRPTRDESTTVALGWHISKINGREIVWHNGGTGGYRSFMGFDPKTKSGVVLLSNMSTAAGVDDLGRNLLAPPQERKTVKVDAKVLEKYTGYYELAPGFHLHITRDGEQLFVQATGQPRFPLEAESETKFTIQSVGAQITFEEGALVLHQNGDRRAKRIEGAPPPPKVRKEIALDAKILDNYVGRYELSPAFRIEITRDGDQLFAQPTGQPKVPLFAESEREFFFKVVDAQITFEVDDKGRATGLVLHQFGAKMPGKRVD
jgi:serine-type D-Ala-D-Ala carboxypeptidase/endopeptidase